MRAHSILSLAALAVAGVAVAAPSVPLSDSLAQEKQPAAKRQVTKEERAKAINLLESRSASMTTLREKANAITGKMAEIAKSGKVTSDESIKALQDMVQELQGINEKLKKMQEEIDEIKGWIEGQNESLPVITNDVDQLKRVSWGSYVQFQYQDTEEGPNKAGGSNRTNSDGLALRRFRISTTNKIDPRTQMKLSFDVAAGGSRTSAELKDAILQYDIVPSDTTVGVQVLAGQQPLPLGYELERSSSEREMPERSIYNRTMFNGERGRGVYLKYGLGGSSFAHFGVWNPLTFTDPQQSDSGSFRNLDGTKMAFSGGFRTAGTHYDVGISGFFGQRPSTSAKTITTFTDLNNNGVVDAGEVKNTLVPATPKNDRRFIYLDGTYVGLLVPQLTVRGEFMWGKDRVPTLSSGVPVALAETNMSGYQLQATYNLNYRNALTARYEAFDPDTGVGNNTSSAFGLGYSYYINPGVKLSLAHEWFKEQPFNAKNNVWTIRIQYRFQ